MQNLEDKHINHVIHRADSRNSADFGWLKVNHTFSFANYYNPQRMNFGVLRVLNDDKIMGGKGFGSHPHENMEIITIPLEGSLKHEDSIGNGSIINEGDIQVMSAGKGIHHSEYNADDKLEVKLLQIWLIPNKLNVRPRYQQISLKKISKKNIFYQILSPNKEDQGVWIHQDAWFYIGDFTKTIKLNYEINSNKNGVYVFIIKGKANIDDNLLEKRDAIGIWDADLINFDVSPNTKILIMEVPMNPMK
ncbi:MAG: hypothetical protein CL844_08585 [Crocinitomicaceae bacterium]|nr:hypothetical protein [Crocinitomicaceae bacterium]|tara:strand:- start:3186 stop:3929 length:744 start_codon:yes stop_codon:yes gene_type:complete